MICAILLTALVIYTILIEEPELIVNKLSLRCMLFVFGIFSIDLWLRGMGPMGSVAYLAAMMIIISTNDNEPNNAAYILLFYDTFAILHFSNAIIPPNTQEDSSLSTLWTSYPKTDNKPQTYYKM